MTTSTNLQSQMNQAANILEAASMQAQREQGEQGVVNGPLGVELAQMTVRLRDILAVHA